MEFYCRRSQGSRLGQGFNDNLKNVAPLPNHSSELQSGQQVQLAHATTCSVCGQMLLLENSAQIDLRSLCIVKAQ
ncbi:hypothetical protein CEXT_45611 [Caerostris extrusa]|uniref:Uncharacterized protein n=1 Tax=Caerostris extrusa TaxID=172846 RepID=A0AAV4MN87_CAEEX|nr:hypothetical protein CEXT_45611 [Caerostris extrusa]